MKTFDLLPVDEANPAFPAAVSGEVGLSPAAIAGLQETPVADLRDLTFPYAGDAADAFTLTMGRGPDSLIRAPVRCSSGRPRDRGRLWGSGYISSTLAMAQHFWG